METFHFSFKCITNFEKTWGCKLLSETYWDRNMIKIIAKLILFHSLQLSIPYINAVTTTWVWLLIKIACWG